MKREVVLSLGFGSLALVAGAVCHRVAPGLGLLLMPMFWPLAILSTRVSIGKAALTSAIVPFVSMLLTGMPEWPLIVALKFAALSSLVSLSWRLVAHFRAR